jgi:hypothetical protein
MKTVTVIINVFKKLSFGISVANKDTLCAALSPPPECPGAVVFDQFSRDPFPCILNSFRDKVMSASV